MCNFLVSQNWLQLKGFFLFLAYCVLFFHQKKLTFTCMSIWLNKIYIWALNVTIQYITLFKEWYQKYKKKFLSNFYAKVFIYNFFPFAPILIITVNIFWYKGFFKKNINFYFRQWGQKRCRSSYDWQTRPPICPDLKDNFLHYLSKQSYN